MHKTHCSGLESRGHCLGSVRIVGLLTSLGFSPNRGLLRLELRRRCLLQPSSLLLGSIWVRRTSSWFFYLGFLICCSWFGFFWLCMSDLLLVISFFLICSLWFSGLKSLYGTRVLVIEIESLELDLLHQNRVQWARDLSFLNSLETVLTNEIVWNLLSFSNFSQREEYIIK